jgi:hypothetical protein
MRTRKEQAEHFYTPLGIAFRIIGASHSEAFGKCFIVEGVVLPTNLDSQGLVF